MGFRSALRRHPRAWGAGVAAAVGLVAFVLVWFQPQKLFLDQRVDEALPSGGPRATAGPIAGSGAPATPVERPSEPAGGATGPAETPATGGPEPEELAAGDFRSLEHHSTGVARLLRLPNGDLYLRFEDLDTSNGPDLVVYLSPREASDDWHGWDQGGYLDLGSLKGNVGDQNYLLPAGANPAKYRSAVIWCRRFKVGFAVAPLAAG